MRCTITSSTTITRDPVEPSTMAVFIGTDQVVLLLSVTETFVVVCASAALHPVNLNVCSTTFAVTKLRVYEDMYLWLNQDLGYLMEQLDRRIGRNNYQVMVIGRPVLGIDAQTLADIHMPVQQFSVDRAAALTGTYLMAIYGHERWVDGGYGQSLYLNRTLIEKKRLSLEALQRQVANFLMDFEGVQIAMPAHEAVLYPAIASTLSKRHTGDVVFMLQPGWQLMQNDKHAIDRVIDDKPIAPLLYLSGALKPMPSGKIDATNIADLLLE